jgi:hypothetical protein
MIKHNQDGAASGVMISLILTIVLLLGAIGFGFWAFSSRQDYKDNSDAKADAAVRVAVEKESATKDKQFAEEEKNPLKTYNGPEALGSLVIKYPKTWSGYVSANTGSNSSLDAYFNPDVVPAVGNQDSTFALHVQVVSQPYTRTLQTFANQQKAGKLTISAYALPKLPKVVGVRVTGKLSQRHDGTVVVLPLRSQTIEIETDGTQFLSDYDNIILPNFSFLP